MLDCDGSRSAGPELELDDPRLTRARAGGTAADTRPQALQSGLVPNPVPQELSPTDGRIELFKTPRLAGTEGARGERDLIDRAAGELDVDANRPRLVEGIKRERT